MLQIMMPKNYVNIVAGLISLVFERLGGSKPEVKAEPDNLTRINGIGPTFARRLNEAGIYSFAALAAATPEHIREVTKVANWQADPADWIVAAKALV
jgi:predicted flap endonuclease-1-like 5' DNA nuclease